MAAYVSQAGLPSVPLTNVLVDGYGGGAGQNSGEVSLDIEMVISMAPGLSAVIVYEGSTFAATCSTDPPETLAAGWDATDAALAAALCGN